MRNVSSSRLEVFGEKGAVKNFAELIREHPCPSFFFNKTTCLRPLTLLKKRLWDMCFSVNFEKFLITPSYITPPVAAPEM